MSGSLLDVHEGALHGRSLEGHLALARDENRLRLGPEPHRARGATPRQLESGSGSDFVPSLGEGTTGRARTWRLRGRGDRGRTPAQALCGNPVVHIGDSGVLGGPRTIQTRAGRGSRTVIAARRWPGQVFASAELIASVGTECTRALAGVASASQPLLGGLPRTPRSARDNQTRSSDHASRPRLVRVGPEQRMWRRAGRTGICRERGGAAGEDERVE